MPQNNTRYFVVLSIVVLLCAFLYKKRSDDVLREKLGEVLRGLLRAERKVGVDKSTRIAIGFGGCEDIFVNAQAVFEKLNFTAQDDPEHMEEIHSEKDLMKMFTYFFKQGAAAELVSLQ